MRRDSILFMFHCSEGTGYAIEALEEVFFQAALCAGYSRSQIHYSYSRTGADKHPLSPRQLLEENRLQFDYGDIDNDAVKRLENYLNRSRIRTVFAFDLPVESRLCPTLRRCGVDTIIAYWGAPISSKNGALKLLAKRIEVLLRRAQPNLYIFESQAMVDTAVRGRGIPPHRVRLVHLGVDTERFNARRHPSTYTRQSFSIPEDRLVVLYSGHMEKRKGVDVIVRAAAHLANHQHLESFHFVFCGNVNGEEQVFWPLFKGTRAERFITFAGYRRDIAALMASSDVGVIASTGWDSFTMSSLEMAAAGLPLVVSNLQGLAETVDPGVTGFTFRPGAHQELAERLRMLKDDSALRNRMSLASRERAERLFSRKKQIERLAAILRKSQ